MNFHKEYYSKLLYSNKPSFFGGRYFFARWNVDVAHMFVVVGETGDTDYEELLGGNHKTMVVKDVVQVGSESKLRAPGNYDRSDIAPLEAPNVITTDIDSLCEDIVNALK
jgi:sucrose-phosphate synthase